MKLKTHHKQKIPLLSVRQKKIFDVINQDINGLTYREIAKKMKMEINSICPRVNEMKNLGLIESKEKRECSITKKLAKVWVIT